MAERPGGATEPTPSGGDRTAATASELTDTEDIGGGGALTGTEESPVSPAPGGRDEDAPPAAQTGRDEDVGRRPGL